MKSICQVRYSSIVLVCFALFTSAGARANEMVNLVSADFPPYFGPNLPHGGLITQIVIQAFRRSNYTAQVQFLPWPRAIAEVREAKTDGMLALPEMREEEAWFAYSAPILQLQLGFFKQRDRQIEFKDMLDLKQFKIGTVRGYPNPPIFSYAQLSSFDSLDDATNLRKLAVGRLDLVLTDRLVGKFLLESRLADMRVALAWQGQAIATPAQYLVLAKKRPGYEKKMQAFNDGLQQMAQDGSLKELLRQAGVE